MKIYCSQSMPGFYVEGISNLPDDANEISAERWQLLLEGQSAGKLIDFSSMPPALIDYVRTAEDDIAEAEAKKAELRLMAGSKIAPLHDAVSLGIATNEETTSYNNWRKFRVLLNRVDTAIAPDINWPAAPTV